MEICIYETNQEYKARMVIDLLEENEIYTFSKNLGLQNLYGDSKLWTGNNLIVGDIKIYVKNEDFDKAKNIIDQIPLLKEKFNTIENDENENNTYFIQRALLSSFLSFFIVPFFFNLEYIIYCFRNNIRTKSILLIVNVLCLALSLILCIGSFEFTKTIWKWNLLFTFAFSIGKFIELHNNKRKIKYLMIIPIILLIASFNIADQLFGIRLFGN